MPSNPGHKRITAKQETFCQEYIKTGIASSAYKKAYDASNMRESNVYCEASKLLDNPKVSARIEEIREQQKRRYAVDRDKITEMLLEAYDIAKHKGDASAITASADKLARLYGHMIERHETKDVTDQHIEAIETLAAKRKPRLKVAGGSDVEG